MQPSVKLQAEVIFNLIRNKTKVTVVPVREGSAPDTRFPRLSPNTQSPAWAAGGFYFFLFFIISKEWGEKDKNPSLQQWWGVAERPPPPNYVH